jgi:hypothetical protein
MSKISRRTMQYAIMIHVVISFFMFSNTAIFSDDESLNVDGLVSENTFF